MNTLSCMFANSLAHSKAKAQPPLYLIPAMNFCSLKVLHTHQPPIIYKFSKPIISELTT